MTTQASETVTSAVTLGAESAGQGAIATTTNTTDITQPADYSRACQ